MLSRNCNGCSQTKLCSKRYKKVQIHEKVYCPDGTAHLVDSASNKQTIELQIADALQICR